ALQHLPAAPQPYRLTEFVPPFQNSNGVLPSWTGVDLDITSDLSNIGQTFTNKINATLVDVFGPDTLEYDRYRVVFSSFVTMFAPSRRDEDIEALQHGISS